MNLILWQEIIYNLVAAFLFFAAFIILAVDISDMSGLDHTLQAIAVVSIKSTYLRWDEFQCI